MSVFKEVQVVDKGVVDQIAEQDRWLEREVDKVRILPKQVTGQRILSDQIKRDDGVGVVPNQSEKDYQMQWLKHFREIQPHWGGDQYLPVPGEFNQETMRILNFAIQNNQGKLRFGGNLYDGGVYIPKVKVPNRAFHKKYLASFDPVRWYSQERQSTIGPFQPLTSSSNNLPRQEQLHKMEVTSVQMWSRPNFVPPREIRDMPQQRLLHPSVVQPLPNSRLLRI